jgi:S-adenosylmethionine:tRNA ribosyltransferase-isomerase
MLVHELDYPLPESLIATEPTEPRDSCRLMVIDRRSGNISHRIFRDLPEFLTPNDILALNSARVTPARLFASPTDDPGRSFEIFIIDSQENHATALVNPSRRVSIGMEFLLPGETIVRVDDEIGGGQWRLSLTDGRGWKEVLHTHGHMPLPPYILKQRTSKSDQPEDRAWYQTTFSEREGAVAAPTAGLHFTPELLEAIEASGTSIERIFLKVGMGTFQPIRTERVEDYKLLPETFEVSEGTAEQIDEGRKSGKRIVCVGTTVVRTLEYIQKRDGKVASGEGETDLMILPGFTFEVTGALLTNFHLPKSTLLALVYAFGGTELIKEAYRVAVAEKYRFYSYGDAMLIV